MDTFQKGCVFPRRTKTRGLVHVIRYRVPTADGRVKHRSETVHTTKKKEAEKILNERLNAINGGMRLPTEITFAQFIDSHWEPYLSNLKPSTKEVHRSNVKNHIMPDLGQHKLSDVRAQMLAGLLERKRLEGLKPKTRLNLYLLLGKMFNLAVALELVESSPVQRIPRPRVEREEKPTLAPKQIEAVIANVPPQYRALFVVLVFTGLRIGEALGLKWQDVDSENGKLYIRRSIWRGQELTPKSKRSIRSKHMVLTLARALAWHRTVAHYSQPEHYIFAGGSGGPLHPDDVRRRVLYPAMDKVGITRVKRAFGFHLFRHSAGTELQQATGDIKTTSSFLGHASTAITGDVYLHLTPDADRSSMEKLESAMSFPTALFPNVPKLAGSVN